MGLPSGNCNRVRKGGRLRRGERYLPLTMSLLVICAACRATLINCAMRWLVIPFLVALTIALGASYSSTLIYGFMGPWSATAVEQDGSLTHMQFGQHLPRPSWVPLYPGAWVVQASNPHIGEHAGWSSFPRSRHARLARRGQALLYRRTHRLGLRGRRPRPDVAQSRNRAPPRHSRHALRQARRHRRPDRNPGSHARRADPIAHLQIRWRKISETPPVYTPPASPPERRTNPRRACRPRGALDRAIARQFHVGARMPCYSVIA